MAKVSDKYRQRISRISAATTALRDVGAGMYEKGLQDATEDQLYKRTPLPVTRDMFNSIGHKFTGVNGFVVGYNLAPGRKVQHVGYRLDMTGTSVYGGHNKTMNPSRYLRVNVDPKFRILTKASHKRILGD